VAGDSCAASDFSKAAKLDTSCVRSGASPSGLRPGRVGQQGALKLSRLERLEAKLRWRGKMLSACVSPSATASIREMIWSVSVTNLPSAE